MNKFPFKIQMASICLFTVLVFLTAPANAAVQVNDRTDIFFSFFVPCAAEGLGEIIDVAGPLHILISFTINGNNVSGKFHFQPQDVTGTGETTGAHYSATGVTQQSFKTSFQNGQAILTYVNNFRMIGQGPGNNFLVHETFHSTINADGTTTVYHDNFSIDCK